VALVDVVIDTDVLMHAENEESADQEPSRRLIRRLLNSETRLCFDEGFNAEEAKNRSAIAGEYFERLPHGALGLALVLERALAGQIRVLPLKVPPPVNRAINQLVWDKSDRKFVKVAYNSTERTLVTHNTTHLAPATAALGQRFDVDVVDAYACDARL
jgi:predicted nucleic acid-binding protein